ncbi:putative metallo-beta-lactamase domain protein [Dactylonectria estremocensis]|uniref:Metallo-beta-lactamase domain protein n=1 Tax=Dactylonectria estremocensis TaxID=1079267 RepID=A0A9P9F1M9_9HYPO|nr:putative metallo-beta-lactamase domain protein [Dactylonectria estremocensis]
MKLVHPHICGGSQVTPRLVQALPAAVRSPTLGNTKPPLCRVHPAQKKAPYTTSSLTERVPSVDTTINRPSPRRILDCVEGCMHPLPPHGLQRLPKTRAPYSTRAMSAGEPTVHDIFEPKTSTWQYIVADPSTSTAVIIDPVLDYDPATLVVATEAADALLSLIKDKDYKVDWILETHAHADHLTSVSYLQKRLAEEQGYKPRVGIGKRIEQVQELFGGKYGIPAEEYGRVFDKLFDDDEVFSIGKLSATVMHLPGHTPDHLGYKVGDNVFCGDSLFHPDLGTARCDFPGGSASSLFNSGRRLLSLPDHVKIWTGHDYPPESRDGPVPWMSVKDHKAQNKHLRDGITEQEFVALRKERDATLAEPRLIHQSLQVNIRAGHLPKANEAGHRLLHVPMKQKGVTW